MKRCVLQNKSAGPLRCTDCIARKSPHYCRHSLSVYLEEQFTIGIEICEVILLPETQNFLLDGSERAGNRFGYFDIAVHHAVADRNGHRQDLHFRH